MAIDTTSGDPINPSKPGGVSFVAEEIVSVTEESFSPESSEEGQSLSKPVEEK